MDRNVVFILYGAPDWESINPLQYEGAISMGVDLHSGTFRKWIESGFHILDGGSDPVAVGVALVNSAASSIMPGPYRAKDKNAATQVVDIPGLVSLDRITPALRLSYHNDSGSIWSTVLVLQTAWNSVRGTIDRDLPAVDRGLWNTLGLVSLDRITPALRLSYHNDCIPEQQFQHTVSLETIEDLSRQWAQM
ncbi:unnamed protein product [Cuscuta campestris]|uniref:Uncharacterized protein n=1 Tax=Cuscuta campestris TaxID=132261 RepID=A0A484NCK4_9ASTE|nr:unnamed protein product [Cuscuta campestris]